MSRTSRGVRMDLDERPLGEVISVDRETEGAFLELAHDSSHDVSGAN
jgi:hypothetical protein